jgi:hypothetical protein
MLDAKANCGSVLVASGVGLLLLLILTRGFLAESFWLDETISAWIVSGSASEAYERSLRFQGQSPLYYVGLWIWAQLAGSSEQALRFPSLVLLGATLVVVYRWIRSSLGLYPAALGVVTLLSIDSFVLALSARPYAAGLLSVTLSLFFTDRGLREGRKSVLVLGGFFLALSCYFHFLFALAGFVILLRAGNEIGKVVGPLLLSSVACVPLLGQFFSLSERREALLFRAPPTIEELTRVVLPLPTLLQLVMAVAAVLICSSFIAGAGGSGDRASDKRPMTCSWWIIGWWLLPALSLWLLARLEVGPFMDRYVLYTLPAVAILVAHASRRFCSLQSQRILFLAFSLFVAARFFERVWIVEDWRGAFKELASSGACQEGEQILVYSGLVELENSAWRKDRAMGEYLTAPAEVYAKGFIARPIGLTSDFVREVHEGAPVCGVVLLKRSPPPQVGLDPATRMSSEKLIVLSLESIGTKLERISPENQLVSAYRVLPRS